MQVKIDFPSLKKARWQEVGIRFLFGGLVTAVAGMIAKAYGPSLGGLLLAFPAIFPAGATLIENHEKQKKQREGLDGSRRGRQAAAVDAAGAAMGAFGLLVFAALVEKLIVTQPSWLVMAGSTAAWLAVSVLIWRIRKFM